MATVLPKEHKVFEAKDSDFGGSWDGMEVCSSDEMGFQAPRIREWKIGPKPTEADHEQSC
jgi:hypothetical protein